MLQQVHGQDIGSHIFISVSPVLIHNNQYMGVYIVGDKEITADFKMNYKIKVHKS